MPRVPTMTAEEAVRALDAIHPEGGGRDIETTHILADDVLLETVPAEVREAYERLQARMKDWWYA